MASETFDDIVSFGRYQIITMILLSLPAAFMDSWSLFALVFLFYSPEKKCVQWNVTLPAVYSNSSLDNCEISTKLPSDNIYAHCQKWTFDKTYFDSTVVTQWNLVCENAYWPSAYISICTVVGIIFALPMAFIMDYYGRKVAFLVCITLQVVGGTAPLLASTFLEFAILRCIACTQVVTTYVIPLTWAMEFTHADKRTWVNALFGTMYAVASMSLGLVAYLCRTWVQLAVTTTVPFIAFYSYTWLVDESPRWLLSVGKMDKAVKIMQKVYKRNGVKVEPETIRQHLQAIDDASHSTNLTAGHVKPTVLDLFRTKHLRVKTILITLIWATNVLLYNSVAFNAPNLTNMYVAFTLQAAVEMPASVINFLVLNKIGRILPMFTSMLVGAFFCFMCIPAYALYWNGWCVILFSALAKFCVCISFNACYQAAGELYPTTLRATGSFFSGLAGSLSIVIMPKILQLASTEPWLPMLVMGTLVMIAALCAIFLPETAHQTMPQTAEEAEQFEIVGCQAARSHFDRAVCRRGRSLEQCSMPLMHATVYDYGTHVD